MTRLDAVATELRNAVDPAVLGDEEVLHFSIPALDATGSPAQELASEIGSLKIALSGGEVLVSRLNPRKARIVIVPDALAHRALASGEFVVLRPDRIERRFLSYFLLAESTRQDLDAGVQSVTRSHQRVRPEQIRQMRLHLPGVDEQSAIADFLDAETARIDALIEKKRRMIELVAERERRRIALLCTGGVQLADPFGVTRSDCAPGWTPMKLSWLGRFGSGTTPSTSSPLEGSIPWVVTGELRDATVTSTKGAVLPQTLRETSALALHPAGSVVIAMYGATIGRLGILGMDATVNQACCVITTPQPLMAKYLFWYLKVHRRELVERGRGAGQPNIGQELIRSLIVAVPLDSALASLLARIEREHERSHATVDRVTRQIALLREHRQALITAAVTGDLAVPGVAA